jgi:hypothetical protein
MQKRRTKLGYGMRSAEMYIAFSLRNHFAVAGNKSKREAHTYVVESIERIARESPTLFKSPVFSSDGGQTPLTMLIRNAMRTFSAEVVIPGMYNAGVPRKSTPRQYITYNTRCLVRQWALHEEFLYPTKTALERYESIATFAYSKNYFERAFSGENVLKILEECHLNDKELAVLKNKNLGYMRDAYMGTTELHEVSFFVGIAELYVGMVDGGELRETVVLEALENSVIDRFCVVEMSDDEGEAPGQEEGGGARADARAGAGADTGGYLYMDESLDVPWPSACPSPIESIDWSKMEELDVDETDNVSQASFYPHPPSLQTDDTGEL